MHLKIKRMKEDDEQVGCAKGDLILVDVDYDWDPVEKFRGLYNLSRGRGLSNSFYHHQLLPLSRDDAYDLVERIL